jgi:hypothetical protein
VKTSKALCLAATVRVEGATALGLRLTVFTSVDCAAG